MWFLDCDRMYPASKYYLVLVLPGSRRKSATSSTTVYGATAQARARIRDDIIIEVSNHASINLLY
jgi:hypothetical protein